MTTVPNIALSHQRPLILLPPLQGKCLFLDNNNCSISAASEFEGDNRNNINNI